MMVVFDALEQLVSMPLPMAYLQQRKHLFLAFVFVYPLTLPNADGLWTNVITPSLIFLAMMGFESVAEMLENPLGDDSLDLNIAEMMHDLEVRVSKVLGFAEERLGAMQRASAELLEHMPLEEDAREAEGNKEKVETLRRLASDWGFAAHFVWRPVPPQVLVQTLAQMHAVGHKADEEMRQQVLRRHLSDSSESASDCSSLSSDEDSPSGSSQKYARLNMASRLRRRSAQEMYRSVSLTLAGSAISRKDFLGIDHFLCLRARAPAIETLLEEFGREYVRDKKRKGAGGRLLSRLHDSWVPCERPPPELASPHK
mmetsp:Transcript_5097/g.11998  ORF Transcript_5097/g.11998 Transcript_5097/m.11998 type:complete len:313 (-) Transcript_5097:50-988(-)